MNQIELNSDRMSRISRIINCPQHNCSVHSSRISNQQMQQALLIFTWKFVEFGVFINLFYNDSDAKTMTYKVLFRVLASGTFQ